VLARGTVRERKIARLHEPSRRERVLLGTAGIAIVLAAWQVCADTGVVDPLVASSPSRIVDAARTLMDQGTLLPAIGSTAKLFALGFGLSLVTGLVAGVILGWYKRIDAVVDPWLSVLYATPRIALIPLIMVWTGIGLETQVIIVWTVAVFPIVINVAAGVAAIDRDHLRVARSFLATNHDVLRTVALPGSMPFVLSGVRQGLFQGLIGVVVAEYFVGNTGVGGLIFSAGQTLESGQAFVGAIVFALAALILTAALRAIERRVDQWR
jgi:ABC-type nitrate/sulfonate/bicarbonate transport system permease component